MSHRTNWIRSLLRTKWKPQHDSNASILRNMFQDYTLILLSSFKNTVAATLNEISKNEI